ncbi:hypothetical protein PG984_014934 [Apiospora sp. TS-2023a]
MDTAATYSMPIADSSVMEWNGGKLRLHKFYGIKPLDQALRSVSVSLAPSTLGLDSISEWQFFEFLIDMGPVYAIWSLESSRPANRRSPAYYTLTWFVGIGTVVPLFYFLCIAFGPSAFELTKVPRRRGCWKDDGRTIVPVIMLFHAAAAPHSLPTLFMPSPEPQAGLMLHMRKAFQVDEIITIVSNGLWLAYSFAELHLVGLLDKEAAGYVAMYPLMVLLTGPGMAFAMVWQLREDILDGMRTS